MKKKKVNVYGIVIGTILVLYSLSIILILLWGFNTSIKFRTDFEAHNMFGLPKFDIWHKVSQSSIYAADYTAPYVPDFLGNYVNAVKNIRITSSGHASGYYIGLNLDIHKNIYYDYKLGGIILNTLIYVIGTALCATIAPCLGGYLCSKFDFKFSTIVYIFVLIAISLPIVGNTTAVLTLLKRICIYDTYFAMWFKSFNFASTNFLIFYAFFKGMSNTYSESAQIDGASYFRVMVTIYLPLASKIFSTIFLMQFVALYNDYTVNLYYLPSHPTLSYAIWDLMSNSVIAHVPEKLAASLLLSMPILILFLIFKNKLMGNISLGGIKE